MSTISIKSIDNAHYGVDEKSGKAIHNYRNGAVKNRIWSLTGFVSLVLILAAIAVITDFTMTEATVSDMILDGLAVGLLGGVGIMAFIIALTGTKTVEADYPAVDISERVLNGQHAIGILDDIKHHFDSFPVSINDAISDIENGDDNKDNLKIVSNYVKSKRDYLKRQLTDDDLTVNLDMFFNPVAGALEKSYGYNEQSVASARGDLLKVLRVAHDEVDAGEKTTAYLTDVTVSALEELAAVMGAIDKVNRESEATIAAGQLTDDDKDELALTRVMGELAQFNYQTVAINAQTSM